jgi:hypothetical protein
MEDDKLATTAQKTTVHIQLVTQNESIERVLHERIHVKIGRPVKSAQEKLLLQMAAQEKAADSIPSPTSPIEAGNQDTMRIKGDSNVVFMNAPGPGISPSKEVPEEIVSIDPVWFKSKVVSRSHAEIWLKDGQVGFH